MNSRVVMILVFFLLGPRSRGAPCSRYLPDSRISCEDKLAGGQRSLFEIVCVGREDLPACHLLPEHLDRARVRELPPQTLVVFLGVASHTPLSAVPSRLSRRMRAGLSLPNGSRVSGILPDSQRLLWVRTNFGLGVVERSTESFD
jgi:hypothetical protein